mgnify:CR=1 FL=1
MFGGKKEKALQDELYTIKKQIAEYSDELKEDSVQMTASRVQMEENIEILEEKLECVGDWIRRRAGEREKAQGRLSFSTGRCVQPGNGGGTCKGRRPGAFMRTL